MGCELDSDPFCRTSWNRARSAVALMSGGPGDVGLPIAPAGVGGTTTLRGILRFGASVGNAATLEGGGRRSRGGFDEVRVASSSIGSGLALNGSGFPSATIPV